MGGGGGTGDGVHLLLTGRKRMGWTRRHRNWVEDKGERGREGGREGERGREGGREGGGGRKEKWRVGRKVLVNPIHTDTSVDYLTN